MWLFTDDGFFSAVKETRGKHKGEIALRARSIEDLRRWVAKHDGCSKIHTSQAGEHRDYGYRIWMTPEAFGVALAATGTAVDYPNFKSRVMKTLGAKREHMLHDVWSVMAKLQPGGAYGVGRMKTKPLAGDWRSRVYGGGFDGWDDDPTELDDDGVNDYVGSRLREAFADDPQTSMKLDAIAVPVPAPKKRRRKGGRRA